MSEAAKTILEIVLILVLCLATLCVVNSYYSSEAEATSPYTLEGPFQMYVVPRQKEEKDHMIFLLTKNGKIFTISVNNRGKLKDTEELRWLTRTLYGNDR